MEKVCIHNSPLFQSEQTAPARRLTFFFKLFAAVSHTAICPALPPGFSFRMCVAWC